MKKTAMICLISLLVFLPLFGGCITREQAAVQPDSTPGPSPSVEQTESAEPTPEPTPTPMPYDMAVVNDPVDMARCENDTDVYDALETIRSNAAQPVEKPEITGTNLTDGEQCGDRAADDGDLIFLLAENDLVIVEAAGENTRVLSRTHIGVSWKGDTDAASGAYQGSEKVPTAVFCTGGRAVVLSDRYGYDTAGGTMEYSEYTGVDILDVTDPSAPVLTASLGQDGSLRGARVFGGALCLITEYHVFEDADRGQPTDYIPAWYDLDQATLLSGDRICADREGAFPGGAVIGVYDMTEGRLTDIQMLLGVKADACMEEGTVVFFSARRAEAFSRDVITDGGPGQEMISAGCTDLFVYRIEGDAVNGPEIVSVSGTAADIGCVDLYSGSLRCLAALEQSRTVVRQGAEPEETDSVSGTAIFLLDDTLSLTGTIDRLSDGSTIGWAGFAGNRILLTDTDHTASCVADLSGGEAVLSDPVQPITGRYLRRFGENTYLLYDQNEMGKMTLTACDSMMRVIGEKTFASDHSSTLENHRAYLTDEENNLLTLTADDSYCIYGLSPEKGIELRADVYLNDWAWNAEGIKLGGDLYIIDTKEIRVISLEDLKETAELKL